MDEDEILKEAELHLGPRFNRGKVIAFAQAVWGAGFKAGAAAMRKTYTKRPSKPRVAAKKAAPGNNEGLKQALAALGIKPRRK